MSSPVTDGEQWSDELDEHDTSPQGLGYAPLDYQVLDGEEEDENENEAEETETAVDVQDAASSQQPDVASAMLRAMEADYWACIESEARLAAAPSSVNNGPVTPTTVESSREEHAGPALEANGSVISDGGGGGGGDADGGEGLATAAAEAPPPRPNSPLSQDQAERVMRAMQGFSLTPPVPPPAGFEADWGSADAFASLGATTTAAETNTYRGASGAEEGRGGGGGEVLGRNGPSADRDER